MAVEGENNATDICGIRMILSWLNGETGGLYPDYEWGIINCHFWNRYADGMHYKILIVLIRNGHVFFVIY